MKILIVFPTTLEAERFSYSHTQHNIKVFISGIACYNTLYKLTKECITYKPDLIIHAGIAGAFSNELAITSVVSVVEDCFADVGVNTKDDFSTIFDLGLAHENDFPFTSGTLKLPQTGIHSIVPPVKGVTVNSITADTARREFLEKKFSPQVESMEGAAVHFICLQESIPCVHFRGISNYVGDRNKQNWDIQNTLTQIHKTINEYISLV